MGVECIVLSKLTEFPNIMMFPKMIIQLFSSWGSSHMTLEMTLIFILHLDKFEEKLHSLFYICFSILFSNKLF